MIDRANPYKSLAYRAAWDRGFEDGKAGRRITSAVPYDLRTAHLRGWRAGRQSAIPDLSEWCTWVATLARNLQTALDSGHVGGGYEGVLRDDLERVRRMEGPRA